MKNLHLAIALIIVILSCNQKPVTFVELNQFNTLDTNLADNSRYIYKQVNYIINNFKENDKNLKSIDSVAFTLSGLEANKYSSYTIIFYKSSKITNVEHLERNPRDIDRYSQENDMVFTYNWTNGKFTGRTHTQN